jgi:hypothetical protein
MSTTSKSGGRPDDKLRKLEAEAEVAIRQQDNTSRSKIAMVLTVAFVVFIFVILVGVPVYNAVAGEQYLISIPDTLSSFGSLFGTALGFVLGYYFKDKNGH